MKHEEEIQQFLVAVVNGCAKYIVNTENFAFDIKFELGEKTYRLTMGAEEKENAYLKDN